MMRQDDKDVSHLFSPLHTFPDPDLPPRLWLWREVFVIGAGVLLFTMAALFIGWAFWAAVVLPPLAAWIMFGALLFVAALCLATGFAALNDGFGMVQRRARADDFTF